VNEHEFEPVPGLPEHLPEGERLLWQGAPRWQSIAVRAFHVRKVVVYFALLMAWDATSSITAGMSLLRAVGGVAWVGVLGLLAVGVLSLLAWQSARSTLYTITSRRIVMRFGIALPMSLNLPFSVVDSASLRVHADGTSDIPVAVVKGTRVGYLVNWPHVRPWHVARPQPMLCGIADGERVAELLSSSLSAALGGERKPVPVPAAPAAIAPRPHPEITAAA
jgi:Bacterial PH domain